MQVTVKINSETPTGKRLIRELRKHPKTVEFENSNSSDGIPEGYITLEEFRVLAKERIFDKIKQHGLHK